jgi:hypothetical protein
MRYVVALCAALVVAGSSASATVIRWDLDGVLFNGAGTASGSSLFDSTTSAVSNVALQTSRTAGGGLLYDSYLGSDASSTIFGQASADPDAAQTALSLEDITPGLLGTAGVLPINIVSGGASFAEFGCLDRSDCVGGFGFAVTNWQPGGVSTLTGTVAPVPLPAGLPLLASALALFAGLGVRRRRG